MESSHNRVSETPRAESQSEDQSESGPAPANNYEDEQPVVPLASLTPQAPSGYLDTSMSAAVKPSRCCPWFKRKQKLIGGVAPLSKPMSKMTPEEKKARVKELWRLVRKHVMILRFKMRAK